MAVLVYGSLFYLSSPWAHVIHPPQRIGPDSRAPFYFIAHWRISRILTFLYYIPPSSLARLLIYINLLAIIYPIQRHIHSSKSAPGS
jgi:hypothetical protein